MTLQSDSERIVEITTSQLQGEDDRTHGWRLGVRLC